MQIRIAAVGRVREPFIRDGIAEYAKRLKSYARVDIIETREESFKEDQGHADKVRLIEREGDGLLKALGPGYVIALDVVGTMLSSEDFARHIEKIQIQGVNTIQFVIGGSLGLAPSVLERADLRLSFSLMTFPHQLFRLIVLEQIYRASTILRGTPYHK